MDQFFDRGKVASSGSVRGGIVLWKESFVNKLLVGNPALMYCHQSIEQLTSIGE